MNDLNRRIRAAGRPGPAAFAEDCSLLLLLPDPKDASEALGGLRGGGLRLSLYAVASPTLALEYLRGQERKSAAAPLAVIIDAAPLTAGARKLLAELRDDRGLRYLTVILLGAGKEPALDGVSVTFHFPKPSGEAGYAALAERLSKLLPVAP